MFINLQTKIWLTVLTIVLLFTFFTLFYFPKKQGQELLKNYNTEVQNLARTVALGVKIALDEENYTGVQTAMEFVTGTPGLKFVTVMEIDTVTHEETVFRTFPEMPDKESSDSVIIKRADFKTPFMSGSVVLGFSTAGIIESQKKVRRTSLAVSGGIFLVGLAIGLWLARNISVPVRNLRDAARRVGKGDLTPVTKKFSRDEIGELSKAFNFMVKDIGKAREELKNSNNTLSETNKLLSTTLDDLKSTQTQLIQSEKMASLGELTAGIAHEIQNPLNFVNNFSEVSAELVGELREVEQSGKRDFAQVNDLLTNIEENLQRITFHGKRADTIVKSMLQHSRSSSGIKEPADINALADEYLRLSYHGLRAKDKSFNVTMKTDLDERMEKINIVPQDIGRVLLNLFNNAFYAVTEKKKQLAERLPSDDPGQAGFEPTVSVSSKMIGDMVEIRIRDNGMGVSKKVLDKIFHPFFTTKPTGQGTGLGLSLSYDIIKAHGGDLKVNTAEGEYAELIITLPV